MSGLAAHLLYVRRLVPHFIPLPPRSLLLGYSLARITEGREVGIDVAVQAPILALFVQPLEQGRVVGVELRRAKQTNWVE